MTLDDYIEQAKSYASDYINLNNPTGIELLARIAYESEEAKQKLRAAGFGWTGLGLSMTVDEVLRKRQ